MVHVPTRGEVPIRLGPQIDPLIPDIGPTTMGRDGYTDPVRFELERERVLATHWILAGRAQQIPNPGDWLTYEGHGETVVVTRLRDGGFAAFHNVCQHRGAAIVGELTGCGARRFTCPYHGWVYDTTGDLVGVPERDDFDPSHLDGLRAPAVAVDEWGGWLWINLAGPDHAPPLRDAIGDEIAADLGRYRMEDMVLHEVVEWDVPVSYKAVVDGFNEIYHTKELHGVSPDWVKAARGTSFHIVGDNYMCFVPRAEHLDRLAQDWDHHRYAICHYVVFPNTIFNCNPEHVQVFTPIPLEVDRTRFLCWELVHPERDGDQDYSAYLERTMEHWKVLRGVVGEDIDIYQQLARTKRSSGYTRHVLQGRECKIAHYHENMDRKIRRAGRV